MDRKKAVEAFRNYTSGYDTSDIKVKLKVDHTYRVASNSDRIADSLGLSGEDKDIAWLLGMLHDIGRFEQLRIYHTFRDLLSADHAAMSADILFKDGLIRAFLPEEMSADSSAALLPLLEKAIRLHNVYILPEDLTKREYLFAAILRDADKIDILRVNCETPRSEIYDLPEEEFLTSRITDAVYADFLAERNVNREHSVTAVDFMVGHISFVYGLVYPESFRLVRQQGYLEKMLSFESRNPETAERFVCIRETMHRYMEAHCRG